MLTRREASKALAECLRRDIEADKRRAWMARHRKEAVTAVRDADGVYHFPVEVSDHDRAHKAD